MNSGLIIFSDKTKQVERWLIEVAQSDMIALELDETEKKIITDCFKSDKISMKLSGLQLLFFRMEQQGV